MSAPWSITNTSGSGSAGTASIAQPTSAVAQGQQIRVRSIVATMAGSGAGSDTFQLKDGSTVVFAAQLSIAANGYAQLAVSDLDIRISGTLTAAFAAGVSNDVQTVNVQGDYVKVGLGYGINP